MIAYSYKCTAWTLVINSSKCLPVCITVSRETSDVLIEGATVSLQEKIPLMSIWRDIRRIVESHRHTSAAYTKPGADERQADTDDGKDVSV